MFKNLTQAKQFRKGKDYFVDIGDGKLIPAHFERFSSEFYIVYMSDTDGEFPCPVGAIFESTTNINNNQGKKPNTNREIKKLERGPDHLTQV